MANITNSNNYAGYKNNGTLVFEEAVKELLSLKDVDTISPDDLMNCINSSLGEVREKHEYLLELLDNMPSSLSKNFYAVVKNVMTTSSRLMVHKDKVAETSFIAENKVCEFTDSVYDHVQNLKNDPRKNIITGSYIIRTNAVYSHNYWKKVFTCELGEKLVRDPRKSPLSPETVNIGKLLLEVRISTPLMSMKGYITTGYLEDRYGIGFMAEYIKSVDDCNTLIHASMTTPGFVDFYITRQAMTITVDDVYDNIIPMNIEITPLITGVGGVTLHQSLSAPGLTEVAGGNIIGCGNLSTNGYGPIDVKPGYTDKIVKPKYYKGNDNTIKCITNIPAQDRITSKLLNLKIQPDSYVSNNELPGSHVIRTDFGNHNFDLYNLMREVYNFVDERTYNCHGNIVIGAITIPVIGFVLSKDQGNIVHFIISPYFEVVSQMAIPTGGNGGDGYRKPYVTFKTGSSEPTRIREDGYIGDIKDTTPHYIYGSSELSDLIRPGSIDANFYNHRRDVTRRYALSLIDIAIEINDASGLLNKAKWGVPFRYSGSFNRYDFTATKGDFDNYPYPKYGDIIDGNVVTEEIPGINPEAMIICGVDGVPIVYEEEQETFISYSNNEIK